MFVKGLNYHEEKRRLREEKREAKNRRREEKRAEKNRYREAKRRLRDEFRNGVKNQIAQFLNTSTSETTTQRSNNNNNNNNVVVSNYDINDRVEQDVATIRTIFPDCDPEYIRNSLTKEPVDRVRKVTEKLLTTVYPKVAPESHSTIPTAPPLPSRSSCEFPFNDEPPPTYEESLGQGQSQSQSQGQGNLLQPPPLPKRHQRSSSWNGTSVTSSSQSTRPTRPTQLTRQTQHSSSSCPAAEVTEAIGAAVKNLIANFKPSTVETACHKHSHVWTRPAPTNLRPHSLSQQLKISPKDKYSIQRGFSPNNYPSRELNKHHDISEEDWYLFITGLNSIIGVNSINGSSSNLGDEFTVSLRWVSWLKVTMDEKQMENNITAINEYLNKWNDSFFNPRKIMVQFVDDRSPANVSTNCKNKEKRFSSFKQYLLVTSI